MEIKQEVDIHNRFDIEVRDFRTGEIKQQAYAQNIILNALWARFLGVGSYFVNIHVGTGTGSLSASRTSLFSHLSTKVAGSSVFTLNIAEGWASTRKSIVFTETELVGATLTELGVAFDGSSSYLMTHALLKDMNGNPVSILKTNTDIITIYATVYARIPIGGWDDGHLKVGMYVNTYSPSLLYCATGNAQLSKDNNVATKQRSYVLSSSDSQYSKAVPINTTQVYDIANKKATMGFRLPANLGNFGGIRGISLGTHVWFDVMGSTAFSGSPIVGEVIGTGNGANVDFKTLYPYVKTGAKIYIDGVEQTTGVTVDVNKPESNDLGLDCITIFSSGYNQKNIGWASNPSSGSPYTIFENPYYTSYGINTIACGGQANAQTEIYTSDDGSNWTLVVTAYSTVAIPSNHRHKRYWKAIGLGSYGGTLHSFISSDLAATVMNIHFDTAPANGAVITADYITALIAKDANHVFDLSVVYQFGEYIP